MLDLEQHLQRFRKKSLVEASVPNQTIHLGSNPSYTCRHNCLAIKEETIILEKSPFWRVYYNFNFMNGIESYPEFSQHILKFLKTIHQNHPQLRKPAYLHSNGFEYVNSFLGTIKEFKGLEHIIFDKNTLVLRRSYHGGLYTSNSIQLV